MPAPNANTDWISNPIYDNVVGTDSPTYIEPPVLPDIPIVATSQNNDTMNGGNSDTGGGRTIGFGNMGRPYRPIRKPLLPPISGQISVGAASQTPNLALILAAVVAIFIFRKQSKRRR